MVRVYCTYSGISVCVCVGRREDNRETLDIYVCGVETSDVCVPVRDSLCEWVVLLNPVVISAHLWVWW